VDAVSVVAAKGFSAAGVASGIKENGLDLSVVVADVGCAAAGVFTNNQVCAAPVTVSRTHLEEADAVRAVVINSGCANAATGAEGMRNAEAMASILAEEIGSTSSEVLVASTGTIGPRLPMDVVASGIQTAISSLTDSPSGGADAAAGILTTDTVIKEATVTKDGWTVGGMAKGSGMIRPNMATMIAVLTTDADVPSSALAEALGAAADGSFNSLNIDGCESTNDTAVVLASGASGVTPSQEDLTSALTEVCQSLAMQMAKDAEGASRVVTIAITGATDDATARTLGRIVTDSALVRSSFFRGDVNWGRIMGALGTASSTIDPDATTIAYEGVVVFEGGMGTVFDEPALLASIEHGDFHIDIDLGLGDGVASIVTTDLTPEYVIFNGERS
jgi:glutamate N-acetyltransferase/amino-acid N-acetyltransferase